jgi:hypothetical protein
MASTPAVLKGEVMKTRRAFYMALVALVSMLCTAIVLSQSDNSASKDIKLLTLQVKADKDSYLPGEVITLNFKILNNSRESVLLSKSADVQTGQLQVFIADESNQYNQYSGPRWGLVDVIGGRYITLSPGESFETTATVLHNRRVETSHLSKNAAAEIKKGRIQTDYVMPQAGMYFIKAVLIDDALASKIESEPVGIVIEEPQGADLEVWNKLKSDGDYGLFIQTGEIAERADGPKTKEIVGTLKEIENSYPTSKYLNHIRAALAKQRKILEKKNARQ